MDAILFSSDRVTVGRFRCPVDHPDFADTGPIRDHIFVLPRTSVRIVHEGRTAVVADRNAVMFYNRGQRYRREAVSRRGDLCTWIRVRSDLLLERIAAHGVGGREGGASAAPPPSSDRPFAVRRAPVEARDFSAGVRLVRSIERAEGAGRSARRRVEEEILALLDRVLSVARSSEWSSPGEKENRERGRLAEAARELLARRYDEGLSLEAIAHELATSPFHLARVFRAETGASVHAYRTELRLRAAVDRLAEGTDDLSALAHDLGFSSHSHFANAFRRWSGATPSALREELAHGAASASRRVASRADRARI